MPGTLLYRQEYRDDAPIPLVPGLHDQGRHMVGFYDPKMIELQKEFARTLLTHRNTVTGLTYAEDPAVAFVEINNEYGLIRSWCDGRLDSMPMGIGSTRARGTTTFSVSADPRWSTDGGGMSRRLPCAASRAL